MDIDLAEGFKAFNKKKEKKKLSQHDLINIMSTNKQRRVVSLDDDRPLLEQMLCKTDTLTDRQTDTLTDRQTDTLTDTLPETDRQTDRQTDTLTDTLPETDRQTDTLTDRQTDTQTDRQTDTQTNRRKGTIETLSNKQKTVLEFLKKGNGFTTYQHMEEALNIKYSTLRWSMRILYQCGFISKTSHVRKGNLQGLQYTILPLTTDRQTDTQTDRQTNTLTDTPYNKKERQILLNKSFCLSNSDFWVEQGLTDKKLLEWKAEFNFSDEEWQNQLLFGENEPKVKNADNPINYFYKSLKKGGLTRPEGFEFPEERRVRIEKANIEAKQKAVEELEKLKLQKIELDRREWFLSFLQNREAIAEAIKSIEKDKFLSTNLKRDIKVFRETGKVLDVLESRLHVLVRSWNDDKPKREIE